MNFKSIIYISIFICSILSFSSCKKIEEDVKDNIIENFYEKNILNKDIKIELAIDGTEDITAKYDGYIIRLLKNTYYDGPVTLTKNGINYTGTWKSTEDYGKLTINIPQPATPLPELNFLNRDWKFVEKSIPVMKLSPWFRTNEDKSALHLRRL